MNLSAVLASSFRALTLAAAAAALPAQFLRHVDPGAVAGGNGQTWATAFRTIAEALDEARTLAGYEVWIWIKAGTYTRDSVAWQIPDGVSLYGGFRGVETSLAGRSAGFLTVLDGTRRPLPWGLVDLGRPLLVVEGDAVTIDGLTIRRSYTTCSGSALSVLAGTTLTTVTGCVFEGNQSASSGGAVYTADDSELTCSNCRFVTNQSAASGGAICAVGYLNVQRSVFLGNRAADGGGLYMSDDDSKIANSVFSGNVATYCGGGIRASRSILSSMRISACTLHGNQAYSGGGVYSNIGLVIESCVLWQNRNEVGLTDYDQQLTALLSPHALQYCCVQGWTAAKGGSSCLASDPRFESAYGGDGIAGTGDEDLRPMLLSPCRDGGSWSAAIGNRDCDGNDRVSHLRMDIGAYENPSTLLVGTLRI